MLNIDGKSGSQWQIPAEIANGRPTSAENGFRDPSALYTRQQQTAQQSTQFMITLIEAVLCTAKYYFCHQHHYHDQVQRKARPALMTAECDAR